MLSAIATEFGTDIKAVSVAIFLTLAARPFGALFFGLLADKFGRRPILMIDVTLFWIFSFASAFAPSLAALLILSPLFGFALGREWGIGASLSMDIGRAPCRARGGQSV